jgi:hypothetical protein
MTHVNTTVSWASGLFTLEYRAIYSGRIGTERVIRLAQIIQHLILVKSVTLLKVRGWSDLQGHDVHTKLRENPFSG